MYDRTDILACFGGIIPRPRGSFDPPALYPIFDKNVNIEIEATDDAEAARSRYPVLSKERLACLATLEYYIKIGSVKELPPETTDGLWSTFFPVPKKGTYKMPGCIDLRRPNHI